MPSEATPTTDLSITGRCYCGARRVLADGRPQTVVLCHCADCRRASGAPVAAFAAFASGAVRFDPSLDEGVSRTPGVRRWFCRDCGSPLAGVYDYLPGQVYVPLGLLDQADTLAPDLHAHAEEALSWLHIDDDLPREAGSSRDSLRDPQAE